FGGASAIMKAANSFIDRLAPSDRIAVAGFGLGAPATAFTSDRARVKQAIARMTGQRQNARVLGGRVNVSLSEALAIGRGDQITLETAQARECQGLIGIELAQCRQEVELEARSQAQNVTLDADQSLRSLRDLFSGLSRIDGP